MSLNQKRAAALAYLRERGIYILDGKFCPTNASSTDVAATIARYRRQVEGQAFPAVIRKRKGAA
jgi:hypothetical protein